MPLNLYGRLYYQQLQGPIMKRDEAEHIGLINKPDLQISVKEVSVLLCSILILKTRHYKICPLTFTSKTDQTKNNITFILST